MKPLYPLLFDPVYKDYVWGGDRIRTQFKRPIPPGVYAESWEVSDRTEGMSVVSNGRLAGKSLRGLVEEYGAELLGSAAPAAGAFPLLVKVIDARERLSVQVHPDDETAIRYGGEAKTEMWCSLEDVTARTSVFAGLAEGTTESALRAAVGSGGAARLLKTVRLAGGEAVFVPGGRVHAIDAGNLLLEVQQNSNTTYRLYDWDRKGPDGKSRPLHIEEAIRVIRWHDDLPVKYSPVKSPRSGPNVRWDVLTCPYFRIQRIDVGLPETVAGDGRSFRILFAMQRGIVVEAGGVNVPVPPWTSCLVPASPAQFSLRPAEGEAPVVLITL